MLSIDDVNRLESENKKLKKQLELAKLIMENMLYCLKTEGDDDPNGDCGIKGHVDCKTCQAKRLEEFLKEIEGLEDGN